MEKGSAKDTPLAPLKRGQNAFKNFNNGAIPFQPMAGKLEKGTKACAPLAGMCK